MKKPLPPALFVLKLDVILIWFCALIVIYVMMKYIQRMARTGRQSTSKRVVDCLTEVYCRLFEEASRGLLEITLWLLISLLRLFFGIFIVYAFWNWYICPMLHGIFDEDLRVAVILVGDIGAGKSFLGNAILGLDVFKSQYDGKSVTTEAQSFATKDFFVVDIPGFNDGGDKELLAFRDQAHLAVMRVSRRQMLLCVLSGHGGRLDTGGVNTCKLLQDAYGFSPQETIVILNKDSHGTADASAVINELKGIDPFFETVHPSKLLFFPYLEYVEYPFLLPLYKLAAALSIMDMPQSFVANQQLREQVTALVTKTPHSSHTLRNPIRSSDERTILTEINNKKIAYANWEQERLHNMPNFKWNYMGPYRHLQCLWAGEHMADWNDNFLCVDPPFDLSTWRYTDGSSHYPDMHCVQWYEPSSPWSENNYVCRPKNLKYDYNYKWSYGGPIPDMRCTRILEPSGGGAWADNFFCVSL